MSVFNKKHVLILSRLVFLAVLSTIISTMVLHSVDGLAGTKSRHGPPNRPFGGNHRNNRNNRKRTNEQHNIIGKNSNNTEKNKNDEQSTTTTMLARAFRILYDRGGTTAVLNGCRDTLLDYDARVLVEAAILAGNNPFEGRKKTFRSRGVSSGILNSLLGCCCCCCCGFPGEEKNKDDSSSGANMAVRLMRAYDDIGQTQQQQQNALEPDLVALCLAYVATTTGFFTDGGKAVDLLRESNDGDYSIVAQEFLRRAEQFYPKVPPGSVREGGTDPNKKKQKSDRHAFEGKHGIRILQDAEEFMVLSKPGGMVCYHGGSGGHRRGRHANQGRGKNKNKNNRNKNIPRQRKKSRKENDESLEECLLEYGVPLSTLNQEGRGLVHRIDRGTSGCLVVAKTNRMHAFLLSQFFLRRAKKSYSALVCSSEEKLTKNNIGREISVSIEGRPANSRFDFETSVGEHLSRIRVETQQGRRHQVRIHCSEGLKAPILLDPLYGGQSILSKLMFHINDDDNNNNNNNNETVNEKEENHGGTLLNDAREGQTFCLHASSLTIDAVGIDAHAPLPEWWQQLEAVLQ